MLIDSLPQQLTSAGDIKLHVKQWSPSGTPKAVVIIVHGLAEHSGRYEHVAAFLNAAGYMVIGFDLRGHGRSEGKRIYIDRFQEYVDDLKTMIGALPASVRELPLFILGHSMGSTITLSYLVHEAPDVAGIILTGTTIIPGADIPAVLISLSGILGKLLPKLPTIALDSRLICRDEKVVKAYNDDPLVSNDKIPARTGAELNREFGKIQSKMKGIAVPMLIMHGNEDKISNPQGSQLLFDSMSSADKTLKVWPGLFHELLNEFEKEDVMEMAREWMDERI